MTHLSLTTDEKALLAKRSDQHKYDHGHCLVLSGPRFQTGAARLAARAALRVGAGLVTMGATERCLPELAAHLTEIMLVQIETGSALSSLLEADTRINALCIGPALRVDRHGADILRAALESRRKTVIDADALTLIAENAELRALVHADCVLTPHAGEFARLWPDAGDSPSREIVTRAANETGATLLLKGARTRISGPEGFQEIDSRDVPEAAWLATAGSGDVLAGLIAGCLARGASPQKASVIGAKLHLRAAQMIGPGLVAGDIPEVLPKLLRELLG